MRCVPCVLSSVVHHECVEWVYSERWGIVSGTCVGAEWSEGALTSALSLACACSLGGALSQGSGGRRRVHKTTLSSRTG